MRKMRSLVQSAVIVLATGAAGAVAFNAWADKTDKVTDKRPPACDQHRPGRPGPDAEGPGAPGGPGSGPRPAAVKLTSGAVRYSSPGDE